MQASIERHQRVAIKLPFTADRSGSTCDRRRDSGPRLEPSSAANACASFARRRLAASNPGWRSRREDLPFGIAYAERVREMVDRDVSDERDQEDDCNIQPGQSRKRSD